MSVPVVAVIAMIAQVTYGQWGSNGQGSSPGGFSPAMAMGGGMNGGMGSTMGATMGSPMGGGMGSPMGGGMGSPMGGGMGSPMGGGMGSPMGGGMGSPMGGGMGSPMGGGMGSPMGGGMGSPMGGGMGSPMGGGMGSPMGGGMGSPMGGGMGPSTIGAGDRGSAIGGGMEGGIGQSFGGGMGSSIAAAMSAAMARNMGPNMGAGASMPQFGPMNQGFGGMNLGGPAAGTSFGSRSGPWGSGASDDGASSSSSSGWGSSSSSNGWSRTSNEGMDTTPFGSMGPGFQMAAGSRFPVGAMGGSSGWGRGMWNSMFTADGSLTETTITCAFEDKDFRGAATFRRRPNPWGLGMARGGVSGTLDVTSTTGMDETFEVMLTERSRVEGGCSADGLGPIVSRRLRGGWWGMWGRAPSQEGLGTVTVEAGQTRVGVRLTNLPFDELEQYAGRGFALCTGTETGANGRDVCAEPIIACCKLGFDHNDGVTPPV